MGAILSRPLLWRTKSGLFRVEASVDGEIVWIESQKPLQASVEGFVSAFLLLAMAANCPLTVDAELDVVFIENLDRLQDKAASWWPNLSKIVVEPTALHELAPTSGAAIFFTAGVDSFFTLRRNFQSIDRLVNVRGFDIALQDTLRLQDNATLLDEIGRELGKEVVHVSTNLRENSWFSSLDWGMFTHISAISTISHSISPAVSTVYVASSDITPPWGSHQDIDPLWSSSALSLISDGWEFSRLEKVKEIVDWDIVNRSLKVCWENREATLNCGYCEKCVRTQLQFLCAGAKKPPITFPDGSLYQRVEALTTMPDHLLKHWEEIYESLPDALLRGAVERLLQKNNTRANSSSQQYILQDDERQKQGKELDQRANQEVMRGIGMVYEVSQQESDSLGKRLSSAEAFPRELNATVHESVSAQVRLVAHARAARGRLGVLSASTSWRITASLRRALKWFG